MKKGWEMKKLGELCNIKTGKLDSNAMVEDGKYPFFTCSREIFAIDEYAFDCEAILLAGNNASGDFNVKHYKGKFNAYQRTYVITIKAENKILYSYLNQQLINHLKKFKEQSVGANTKFLKLGMIQGMEIPLPPLSEQQRIVSILDKCFTAIDQAKSIAEQNLKNAKELFERLLQKYFTNRNEGWEEKKLIEVAEYFNGLTYSPKNVSDKGIIVLRSSNIQNDKLDFFDIVRVDVSVKEKIIVREGDILMCSRNGSQRLVGKTARIENLSEQMTFGTFMMIIRSEYNPYLLWFFKSMNFKSQISGGENTMINQITRYMLDDVVISFPPLEKLKEIVNQLDAINLETQKLENKYKKKIDDLEELKKSILQKAFSGEL